MGLFTDIYNTVARFFRAQDEPMGDDPSKSVAQNRLKLVLMQDRTNLTPKILEQMRGEMIELLSKYLEMDKELLELNFEQEGNQVALMLSIPVIRAKDEEEIEAAINKAEDNETSESEDKSSEECIEESSDETDDTRSKTVSAPKELSGNENNNEEIQTEEHTENTENEIVCENSEN